MYAYFVLSFFQTGGCMTTDSSCFLPNGLQVIGLVFQTTSPRFTPADGAPVAQPRGIIVPAVWDEKDFFQIESFLQCYLLLVLFGAFVCSSLGWDTASFHSLRAADDVGVKCHRAGLVLARTDVSVWWMIPCEQSSHVWRHWLRASGGLTGRLNIGLWDWTLNALTINWLCRYSSSCRSFDRDCNFFI